MGYRVRTCKAIFLVISHRNTMIGRKSNAICVSQFIARGGITYLQHRPEFDDIQLRLAKTRTRAPG